MNSFWISRFRFPIQQILWIAITPNKPRKTTNRIRSKLLKNHIHQVHRYGRFCHHGFFSGVFVFGSTIPIRSYKVHLRSAPLPNHRWIYTFSLSCWIVSHDCHGKKVNLMASFLLKRQIVSENLRGYVSFTEGNISILSLFAKDEKYLISTLEFGTYKSWWCGNKRRTWTWMEGHNASLTWKVKPSKSLIYMYVRADIQC